MNQALYAHMNNKRKRKKKKKKGFSEVLHTYTLLYLQYTLIILTLSITLSLLHPYFNSF
jgi:hypothetical protein